MDNGNIDALTPQEDEFALLLQGAPSLYRGFLDPRRLLELATEHFDNSAPDNAWVPAWLRFLAGVETQGGSARLVLKSPNHTLRLALLQQALPESPQVWIGRSLREVWWSNQHMWRAMFDRYALWPCPERVLDDFLRRCVQAYIISLRTALQEDSGTSPRRVWVDFEALTVDGLPVLRQLTKALRLASHTFDEQVLQEAIERHPAQSARTTAAALPGDVEALAEEIDALHARARAAWSSNFLDAVDTACTRPP